jgi:hypothetical protein
LRDVAIPFFPFHYSVVPEVISFILLRRNSVRRLIDYNVIIRLLFSFDNPEEASKCFEKLKIGLQIFELSFKNTQKSVFYIFNRFVLLNYKRTAVPNLYPVQQPFFHT